MSTQPKETKEVNNSDKLYAMVEEIVKDKDIDIKDLIYIARHSMEIVETFKGVSGDERKDLVLEVMKRLVNGTVESEYKRKHLLR